MTSQSKPPPPQLHLELAAGAIANMIGSALLNPCDVVKLRLQAQPLLPTHPDAMYRSTLHAFSRVVKEEGVFRLTNSGLWLPGIAPSLLREATYSALRFGLYGPVKKTLSIDDSNLLGKILAGGIAGATGSAMAVPTDRLKIRMQREAGRVGSSGLYETGLFIGKRPTYPTFNLFTSFSMMYRNEGGIRGMWVGWQPTMVRAALLAASQLATYDHTKYVLKNNFQWEDGVHTHVFASFCAGVMAALTTQPADTIRSLIMTSDGKYSGIADCCVKVMRTEGVVGFYRGVLPSYLRFAPHFTISLPLWEQVRKLLGLGYT
jgi:hypothetical protein